MEKAKKYIRTLIVFVIMMSFASSHATVEGKDISIENAKKAIVEVQVGMESYGGDFYQVKSSSGFVVYNQTSGVYVVTTNHTVTVTDEEKSKVCEEKGIDSSSSGLSIKIRVVVEGDVATNVEVKASSEQDDFCVLSVGDVLKKKTVLHLDNNEDYSVGDEIYVLGYSSDSAKSGTYNIEDIEIHSGNIQDMAVDILSSTYIQHSAIISHEQSGGPLLNEEGYLIGMANSSVISEDLNVYYALPIDKIKSILDNYGISYESKEKDTALDELQTLYAKCRKEVDSDAYKKGSKESLASAIAKTEELFAQAEYSIDDINDANRLLVSGEKSLVKKTSKLLIIKYVLLVTLLIVFIRMIKKIVSYCRWRKIVLKSVKDVEDVKAKEVVQKNVRSEEIVAHSKKKEIEDKEKSGVLSYFESDKTVVLRPVNGTVRLHQNYAQVNSVVFDSEYASLLDQISGEKNSISKQEYRIGKSPDNDLQINSNVISRKHALIFWEKGDYYIKDLDSANGTFLNGKELEDIPIKLKNQDLITFANVETMFIAKEVL